MLRVQLKAIWLLHSHFAIKHRIKVFTTFTPPPEYCLILDYLCVSLFLSIVVAEKCYYVLSFLTWTGRKANKSFQHKTLTIRSNHIHWIDERNNVVHKNTYCVHIGVLLHQHTSSSISISQVSSLHDLSRVHMVELLRFWWLHAVYSNVECTLIS